MTTVQFDEDKNALVVSGTGARPQSAVLSGRRATVPARLTGGGKTWKATFAMHVSRWGGPVLPLPSGEYALTVEGVALHELQLERTVTAEMAVAVAGQAVRIGPPLSAEEDSPEGARALEQEYVAMAGGGADAVFFESFYGRTASCNPWAIDREIARRMPHLTRYWGVADLSVPVPEGAIAVVEGTAQWWRARAEARLLVVNEWLRRRFSRKHGQKVLQTWHGTPLKRLGLHRPGFEPRRMAAVIKESRRWDVLLAQNEYSARALGKAYAFGGRAIWVEGYPRNDVLTESDAGAVRAALGIDAGERVLLYAPTWRDDREEMVDFLDAAALAEAAAAVVLVRGHSRTLGQGSDLSGPRVIDVTGYPSTAELMLASDALITDYSSVMFDFSVTGKPMYFFVPDLEHYRGKLRGFYFALAERAPGPLVRTQEELVEALSQVGLEEVYAERYADWRRQFNALDDGRAAARVVDRLVDQGFLPAG